MKYKINTKIYSVLLNFINSVNDIDLIRSFFQMFTYFILFNIFMGGIFFEGRGGYFPTTNPSLSQKPSNKNRTK